MVKMCDSQTSTWCGRISLLFIIFGILFAMMFQIWSYYYSLVLQMDDELIKTPQIEGLLDICDANILNQWNLQNCTISDHVECVLDNTYNDKFLYTSGEGNVTIFDNKLKIYPRETCVKVLILSLPWN
jgi:hypothetical protein